MPAISLVAHTRGSLHSLSEIRTIAHLQQRVVLPGGSKEVADGQAFSVNPATRLRHRPQSQPTVSSRRR